MSGTLYLCATPIGNLEEHDISLCPYFKRS